MISEDIKAKYTIDRDKKVISIRGLKKSFEEFDVLKGVDMDLYQGENLAVLGRSGSGKSVLIKIIAGLLKADEGSVNVLGKEVTKISQKELDRLRLKIGFSFQHSALYDSVSVKENLEFPLRRHNGHLTNAEVNKQVEFYLEAVGLSQTINQMPAELSGGQKKRIGIARTLILKPELMLYDEPTAGLDPITCIDINNLINEVQKRFKTSSIIITHDLSCAKATGDRMMILLEGQFKYEGDFKNVFQHTEDERVRQFYNYNFID
jgi:phospholipid/cholesterol/gamma-HCH transport system ATP-binding protein